MVTICRSLCLLLARAVDDELRRMIQFLKVENEILRSKLPTRIVVTPEERSRLVRFAKAVGSAVRQLVSIVSPRTFLRWLNGKVAGEPKPNAGPGRPRTGEDVRSLVLRMAGETGWGYTRILGELAKLGVKVSRSTVVNILREAGVEPGPKRGEGTWSEFIKRHAATLLACDFFSVKVWTWRGPVEYFVLFFLHVGSRRVRVSGITANPDGPWMAQQARNVSVLFGDAPVKPKYLIRDFDSKFTTQFDAILKQDGIVVKPVGPQAPNLNTFAERWVQSIRRECLDHFVVLGNEHLRHIVSEYVDWYNTFRPHQAVNNRPLTNDCTEAICLPPPTEVTCDTRLGGLLRHYRRAG